MVGGCYIRGDFYVCPNPLSYDSYNMCELNCSFCFIKQLEAGWLRKKTIAGIKPYPLKSLSKQLSKAFDSSDMSDDSVIKALRLKLPVIIGRKSEPFCPSEKTYTNTFKSLEIFEHFGVTAIPETRMVDGVFQAVTVTEAKAVNLSIPFGNESVHSLLDPEAPSYEDRFNLAKDLKASGIYVGLITEPLVPTVNDDLIFYEDYADRAKRCGVDHINFGELKVSSPRIASTLFKARGLDLAHILQSSNFAEEGLKIKGVFDEYAIKSSSPDWINFGWTNSSYGCCGLDPFGTHRFTFQWAGLQLHLGSPAVTISDMKEFNIFGEDELKKFIKIWNNPKQYYTPDSLPNICHRRGEDGNLIYCRNKEERKDAFGKWFT